MGYSQATTGSSMACLSEITSLNFHHQSLRSGYELPSNGMYCPGENKKLTAVHVCQSRYAEFDVTPARYRFRKRARQQARAAELDVLTSMIALLSILLRTYSPKSVDNGRILHPLVHSASAIHGLRYSVRQGRARSCHEVPGAPHRSARSLQIGAKAKPAGQAWYAGWETTIWDWKAVWEFIELHFG